MGKSHLALLTLATAAGPRLSSVAQRLSDGTFYEGCIVTGYPADATEDAVQANVVAAGYGK